MKKMINPVVSRALIIPLKCGIVKIDFEKKLENLMTQMNDLEDSRNSESKSTAGNKHEVGRAIAQNELDNLKKRFEELKGNLAKLSRLDISKSEEVRSGSLVKTRSATFFVGLGIGKFTFEGKPIFIVSPVSPIGEILLGKKVGESFHFNSDVVKILGVE